MDRRSGLSMGPVSLWARALHGRSTPGAVALGGAAVDRVGALIVAVRSIERIRQIEANAFMQQVIMQPPAALPVGLARPNALLPTGTR